MHLLYTNPEIVRRWSNEIHETVQSRATLVQIQGFILFSQIFKDSFLLYKHLHFEILYNNDRVIEISVRTDPSFTVDITEDKEIEADFTYSVKWVDRGDSDSIWTADG